MDSRISLMGLEVLGESGDGGGIFAGSDEQDFALVKIDEQGNVVLAAAGGGLIDADLSDGGMVGFAARRIHVMVEDAPNQGVVFTDQARGSQDGHGLDELEDEGFKQQGEAAVGLWPRVRRRGERRSGNIRRGGCGRGDRFGAGRSSSGAR